MSDYMKHLQGTHLHLPNMLNLPNFTYKNKNSLFIYDGVNVYEISTLSSDFIDNLYNHIYVNNSILYIFILELEDKTIQIKNIIYRNNFFKILDYLDSSSLQYFSRTLSQYLSNVDVHIPLFINSYLIKLAYNNDIDFLLKILHIHRKLLEDYIKQDNVSFSIPSLTYIPPRPKIFREIIEDDEFYDVIYQSHSLIYGVQILKNYYNVNLESSNIEILCEEKNISILLNFLQKHKIIYTSSKVDPLSIDYNNISEIITIDISDNVNINLNIKLLVSSKNLLTHICELDLEFNKIIYDGKIYKDFRSDMGIPSLISDSYLKKLHHQLKYFTDKSRIDIPSLYKIMLKICPTLLRCYSMQLEGIPTSNISKLYSIYDILYDIYTLYPICKF